MSDLRCCKRIWRGFHPHQCTRTGTLEFGGKWWCKQHHPPTKDARYEERKNQQFEQFHAKQHAEREALIADGWRRCAVGQGMTQHCGMAEEARAHERARIIALVQNLGDEWTRAYDINGIDVNEDAIAVLEEVIALINGEALADNRLLRQVEGTSHE